MSHQLLFKKHRAENYSKIFEPMDEHWKEDHQDAMECLDLEQWISDGLLAFNTVKAIYKEIGKMVYAEPPPVDIINCLTEAFQSMFTQWIITAESGDARIASCQKKGYEISRLNDFKQAKATIVAAQKNGITLAVAENPSVMIWRPSADELESLRDGIAKSAKITAAEIKPEIKVKPGGSSLIR